MKKIAGSLLLVLFTVISASSQNEKWLEMAVLGGKEICIDTTSIERDGVEVTVWVKELYTKDKVRDIYLSKLEKAMTGTESGRKSWDKKWGKKFANLSYTLSKRVYNCVNSEFQVLEVSEYDSNDKRIVKTSTKKEKAPWRLVDYDTIGDILMFEVCDKY